MALAAPVQVTAAIAACERPEALLRCVDSILAAEVLPAQLVVVDQSRDAEIGRLLESRATQPVRIDYVHQPRLGLAASRNAAALAAICPVIAYTDDDCVPRADWVAVAARLLDLPEEFAALTGRVLPLGPALPDTFAVSLREGRQIRDYRGRVPPWNVGTGGNLVARGRWLAEVGGVDVRLGAGSPGQAAEDADLIYRLLRAGATIRYDPDAVVYHARQSRAQRLSSRATYGFGIGAFCGLWLRRGDLYPALLLGRWIGRQCRGYAAAVLKGDRFLARQRMLSLHGGRTGLSYGFRQGRTPPPAAIVQYQLQGPPASKDD